MSTTESIARALAMSALLHATSGLLAACIGCFVLGCADAMLFGARTAK